MADRKSPTETAQDALRSSLDLARRLANESMDAGSDAVKKIQDAFDSVVAKGQQTAEDSRKAAQDTITSALEVAKRVASDTMEAGTDAYEDVQGALEQAIRTVKARVRPEDEVTPGASGESHAYESWTKDQLYDRASQLDIKGRSDMNKQQLIDALRAAS